MGKQELENLVRTGNLKVEAATRKEYDGMISAGRTSLKDSQGKDLDKDSQFTLAYGAAHRFGLAALRLQGYRSENRTTVFQVLVHTTDTSTADIQIFLRAHNERNVAEYQGHTDVDRKLVADLIDATKRLEATVGKLKPPAGK